LKKRKSTASSQTGKLLKTVFPAAAILFVGLCIIFAVFVYKISYPGTIPESVNPSHYLLPSLDLATPAANGDMIYGWWIPGLKGAPAVILAPGYGMSRADALSLAAGLHSDGFNIYVYAQRGSAGPARGACTLGLNETEDMLTVVRLLRDRPDVNHEKIGIWGVDIGARAALKAAETVSEIRAIAADSVFQSPRDFLSYRIEEEFGLDNRLVQFGCYQIFRLFHMRGSLSDSENLSLQALADRNILFIKGENRRRLGSLTTDIYDALQPHQELISFKAARIHSMSGEDLKNYDRQVVNFFHLNLK
jgi:hypothetical protein